jgi:hypothetical protein
MRWTLERVKAWVNCVTGSVGGGIRTEKMGTKAIQEMVKGGLS